MNKYFKCLFAIVIFPLLMLLTGCNSEGAFSESTVKLERIDIVASPIKTRGVSELTLAKGNQQSFEAVGHYSGSLSPDSGAEPGSSFGFLPSFSGLSGLGL